MLNDTTLQKNVIEELSWDPALRNAEIGVAAKDGVVTLTGNVGTYSQKIGAEKAARRVTGVRAVADDLVVNVLPGDERSDTDIAHAALHAFTWNVAVPDKSLQVEVRDGWVTLTGEVDWEYQRRAAEGAVRNLAGVRGVTNGITVRSRTSSSDVKERIEAAFRRHAELDADRIQVLTSDGTVTLRGTVRSWAEREDAERAAWAAPGVRHVEDLITVGA